MTPVIKGVGITAVTGGGSNLVCDLPGGANTPVAGDLILVECCSRTNDDLTCASIDGSYPVVDDFPYRPDATAQSFLFAYEAIGADAVPEVTLPGNGAVACVRVIEAGTYDPTDPFVPMVSTNTNLTIPSLSTPVADCLRMVLIGMRNDTNEIGSEAMGSLTVAEDWYDETGAGVSDIAAGGLSAPDPAAQAQGGSFTNLASTTWAVQYAIRPGGPAGPSYPVVNWARNRIRERALI
jgi:hypothetical protein